MECVHGVCVCTVHIVYFGHVILVIMNVSISFVLMLHAHTFAHLYTHHCAFPVQCILSWLVCMGALAFSHPQCSQLLSYWNDVTRD